MATEQIPTTLIADDAVTTAKVADDAVTTAKVADDAITGALIENNPTIAGTLNVTGAFTAAGGIANAGTITAGTIGSAVQVDTQDYIVVKLSGIQTITHNTTTVLNFNSEVHDPNNWFNTTNNRFQPNISGKYFFSLMATVYANQGVNQNEITKIEVSKNDGSSNAQVSSAVTDLRSTRGYNMGQACTGIVDLDGSDDYLFATAKLVDYEGNGTGQVDNGPTLFSIFRIGS